MQQVWIGTSGWIYKHWAESFYPKSLPKDQHLQFYAQQFPTVEINATFYRLPPVSMVKGWNEKAPEGFLYAVKGSRFITHMKKLVDVDEALAKYFKPISHLRSHTGPILWQLPPNLKKDLFRLEDFLSQLPIEYSHAVEFRDPSWVDEETLSLLHRYRAAHVWLSSQRMPIDLHVTSNFVYLRFHGLEHGAAHDYTEKELEPWAEQLVKCAEEHKPSFVYFNNDWNTRAPLNAKTLMRMVGKHAVEPFTNQVLPQPTRRARGGKHEATEPRSKRLHTAGK